ncbi:MAG: hypothetical protein HYR91_09595 [Flavobacteriia bacterium]|nr:hypothetical protein [Flavobacteriia bacterium]
MKTISKHIIPFLIQISFVCILLCNVTHAQCTTPSANCDEYISNVTVGSINNTTACTSGGYVNYYGSQSTNMTTGTGYAITVSNGYPYSGDQCGIWVDWNEDGDFSCYFGGSILKNQAQAI